MILDTSFLIDLLSGDADAAAEATAIDASPHLQRIPAIALYELYVGVGYSDRVAAEIEAIRPILDVRPLEPITPQIAAMAGRIDGMLQRKGERVSPPDVLVGATARHFDEPVLTGNPTDFDRIPDVSVRTYRD